MKTKIKLNTVEEVMKFSAIANKCDFDIDVQYHRFVLDGKSLMGLMSLDLIQPLTIYYNGTNPVFETILREFHSNYEKDIKWLKN